MQSTAETKEHAEDICVKRVNFYFKMLNTVFINFEGDDVTTISVHETYSCGRLKILYKHERNEKEF